MSRSTIRSVRPLASHTVVLVVAAALLAGCSAGQIAETARKKSSVPGVNVNQGAIAIRNALVEPSPEEGGWKPGSEVPIDLRLINTGQVPDTLVRVESENADRVELRAGANQPTGSPSPGLPSEVACASPAVEDLATPQPSPSAPATASPSATETPSATATPPAAASPSEAPVAPLPEQRIVLNPGCLVVLDSTTQQLTLVGLKTEDDEDLLVGGLVRVTLTFQQAGSVSLDLPVAPPRSPLPREESVIEEAHAEG